MKTILKHSFFSIVLLFFGLQITQAQSKTDLENELQKAAAINDSLTARLTGLEVMYTYMKDSVLKTDFDPAKFEIISDSIHSIPDSSKLKLVSGNKILADSITTLNSQIEAQNKTIDNCVFWINASSNVPVSRADFEKGLDKVHQDILTQLGQLKGLLDAGILTQEEFDAKKALLMKKW